jgi:glycosyltransferase involved in cell wall biosynthesis
MKLALVLSSLRPGGAERAFVRLAKALAERGHVVTLVTLDAAHPDDYAVAAAVQRIALGLVTPSAGPLDGLRNNWQRVRTLRSVIRQQGPDVVLAGLSETNVLAVLACTGLNIPVIVSEHNDPKAFPLNRAWDRLRRYTYRRSARLVCVSQGIGEYFDWLPAQQIQVIPNAIDPAELVADSAPPDDFPAVDQQTIVALGRLVYVKGFDILLRIFADIAPAYPHWKLVIVGDGEERGALSELVRELGLAGRAFLPGFLTHPHHYIKPGAFLAFPSRTEGFGLVLAEAFACGLPVVAFDCPYGPREIVQDQVDGFLLQPGDKAGFVQAMVTLMEDEARRDKMAHAALHASQRFEFVNIVPQWERLFAEVVGHAAGQAAHADAGRAKGTPA